MKVTEEYFNRLEKIVSKLPFLYNFLKRSKVKYQRLKYSILKKRNNYIDAMFNRDFFNKNLEWNIPIASKMADILINFFHPKSVVDVGCGNAEFLSQFQKNGITIKGYEGSHHALENALVEREFIELFDLKNKINSSHKYDLVLCLEVAEHIENKFSQRLVENLINLGETIVFTAATPGQGGHFHLNEQLKEFWIDIFRIRDFLYDYDLTERVKTEMEKEEVLWWYRDNLMVFKKKP